MAWALFLVLTEIHKVPEVLCELKKAGATGATVVESVGTGQSLPQPRSPFFSGLRRLVEGDRPHSDTVISVLPNDDLLEKAIRAVEAVVDFGRPGTGLMFTVPVHRVRGAEFNLPGAKGDC
ncbi:MAG: P-II family nitrogen regulator [Bacillota bacterium]